MSPIYITCSVIVDWHHNPGTRFISKCHCQFIYDASNIPCFVSLPLPALMSILEVSQENDQAVVQEAPETTDQANASSKSLEKVLEERAMKRTVSWAQNHHLAEEHCRNVPTNTLYTTYLCILTSLRCLQGDSLLEKGDFTGACACYVDATILWTSNPVCYAKLAEGYIKCHLYVPLATIVFGTPHQS
jgi:hypothetical protein